MREIKFRGGRIDTLEWVYGFPVMVNGGWFMLPFGTPMTQHAYYSDRSCYGIMSSGDVKDLVGHDVQEDNGARMCQVISGTVGQFTGLKDKNGVEIYEGDMLTITDPYDGETSKDAAQVVFSTNYVGGWVLTADFKTFLNIGTRPQYVAVVGNIHDNPELINQ